MANLSDMPAWLVKLVKQTKVEVEDLRAAESVRGHSRLADFKEAFSTFAVLAYRADPNQCLRRTEAFLAESQVAFLENMSANELLRVYVRDLLPKQVNVSISYAKAPEPVSEVVVATVPVQEPWVVVPKAKPLPPPPPPQAIPVASISATLVWDGDRFVPYDESDVLKYYSGAGFRDLWFRQCHSHFPTTLPLVGGFVNVQSFRPVGWREHVIEREVHVNTLPATYRALTSFTKPANPCLIIAAMRPGEVELTRKLSRHLFGREWLDTDNEELFAYHDVDDSVKLLDVLPDFNTPDGMLKLRMMLWMCDPPARVWFRVRGYSVRAIDACSFACVPLHHCPGSGRLLAYAAAAPANGALPFVDLASGHDPGSYTMEARGLRFMFPHSGTGLSALVRAAHCMADGIPFGIDNDVDDLMGVLAGDETVYQSRRRHTDYCSWSLDAPFAVDPLCPSNVVWRMTRQVTPDREGVQKRRLAETVVWQLLPGYDEAVHATCGPIDGMPLSMLAYQLHLRARGTSLHGLATSRAHSRMSLSACFEADVRAFLRLGADDIKFSPVGADPPLFNMCTLGCGHVLRGPCLLFQRLDLDLHPVEIRSIPASVYDDDEDDPDYVHDVDPDEDPYFQSDEVRDFDNAIRLNAILEIIQGLRVSGPPLVGALPSGDAHTTIENIGIYDPSAFDRRISAGALAAFNQRLDALELNARELLRNEPSPPPDALEFAPLDNGADSEDSMPELISGDEPALGSAAGASPQGDSPAGTGWNDGNTSGDKPVD